MKQTHTVVGVALALACAVAGGESFAAEPKPPEPDAAKRAVALMAQARDAAFAGRLDEASTMLHGAWALSRSYRIACNLGAVEFHRGEMRAAAEFLTLCAEQKPRMRTPEELTRDALTAKALSDALQQVVALKIEVSEPGAEVSVDGKPVGQSPLARTVFVYPGPHRITAALAGREAAPVVVDGVKGKSIPVRLSLQSPAAAVSSTAATAATAAASAAESKSAAPVGPARITPRRPLALVAMTPEPLGGRPPLLPLSMGGGAALTLGAGVLFQVLAGLEHGAAQQEAWSSQASESECGPQCDADVAFAGRDTFKGLAVASFTAAAGLGLSAFGLGVFGPKRAHKPAASTSARGVTVWQW